MALLIILFQACNLATTMESCLSINTSFTCLWCEKIGRCSDGVDRYRQEWLENSCISDVRNN